MSNLLNRVRMESTLKSLMVQGTTSDAGKSVLVVGLCRVLKGKGYLINKAQNGRVDKTLVETYTVIALALLAFKLVAI